MAAAVTVSISGVSYAALNPAKIEDQARTVGAQASCRTVDSAIAAYVALNDQQPTKINQLAEFVKGDITAYRIVRGMAAGPGC